MGATKAISHAAVFVTQHITLYVCSVTWCNRSTTETLTKLMTVPVISHFNILLERCQLDPWIYLSVCSLQRWWWTVALEITDNGRQWRESFLSHIYVSTSSFSVDDSVLTKSSNAYTDLWEGVRLKCDQFYWVWCVIPWLWPSFWSLVWCWSSRRTC